MRQVRKAKLSSFRFTFIKPLRFKGPDIHLLSSFKNVPRDYPLETRMNPLILPVNCSEMHYLLMKSSNHTEISEHKLTDKTK